MFNETGSNVPETTVVPENIKMLISKKYMCKKLQLTIRHTHHAHGNLWNVSLLRVANLIKTFACEIFKFLA